MSALLLLLIFFCKLIYQINNSIGNNYNGNDKWIQFFNIYYFTDLDILILNRIDLIEDILIIHFLLATRVE